MTDHELRAQSFLPRAGLTRISTVVSVGATASNLSQDRFEGRALPMMPSGPPAW